METRPLIRLEFTTDLADTGVREVARALAYPARFPHLDSFDRMRQRVADNIASLAFRRYIIQQEIPYQTLESASFTESGRYDVSLGGRRCVPFAQLVCQRDMIQKVHQAPKLLMQDKVYTPEGRSAAYRDVDLYIFITLTALVTRSRDDVDKALLAEQPVYLVHQMPAPWSMPKVWQPMGEMAFKTDISEDTWLELHGQDHRQAYELHCLVLPPRQRVTEQHGFYALGGIHTDLVPNGPVGIFSQALGETLLISPHQWGNIWVYGMRLYLAGYITQAEFYRLADRVGGDQVAEVNPCGQAETLMSIPASSLKPISDLFVRARNWDRQQG